MNGGGTHQAFPTGSGKPLFKNRSTGSQHGANSSSSGDNGSDQYTRSTKGKGDPNGRGGTSPKNPSPDNQISSSNTRDQYSHSKNDGAKLGSVYR